MKRKERGQATVELALTLTLLMFIVFAIIDFGRVFHAYLTIEHAGREAARAASVGAHDNEIKSIVTRAAGSLNAGKVSVDISPAARERGDYVTVTVHYPLPIITPLIEQLLPNPFDIKNQTIMRVE